MKNQKEIVIFEGRKIRRTWFNEEWWFAAIDIIKVLTNSKNPKGYLKDMKRRDKGFSKGWGQIAIPLQIQTKGGKQRLSCVSIKGSFRLIQSIPSLKAEPFKRWLAKVGYERIQEIENPELAQNRARDYYELKGYSKNWIDKRLRRTTIRQGLTGEWKRRGISEKEDYAILTNEISKAIFDISIKDHKKIKGLNLKYKN